MTTNNNATRPAYTPTAAERRVGEIIAEHLHERDPRFVWTTTWSAPPPEELARREGRPAFKDGER